MENITVEYLEQVLNAFQDLVCKLPKLDLNRMPSTAKKFLKRVNKGAELPSVTDDDGNSDLLWMTHEGELWISTGDDFRQVQLSDVPNLTYTDFGLSDYEDTGEPVDDGWREDETGWHFVGIGK